MMSIAKFVLLLLLQRTNQSSITKNPILALSRSALVKRMDTSPVESIVSRAISQQAQIQSLETCLSQLHEQRLLPVIEKPQDTIAQSTQSLGNIQPADDTESTLRLKPKGSQPNWGLLKGTTDHLHGRVILRRKMQMAVKAATEGLEAECKAYRKLARGELEEATISTSHAEKMQKLASSINEELTSAHLPPVDFLANPHYKKMLIRRTDESWKYFLLPSVEELREILQKIDTILKNHEEMFDQTQRNSLEWYARLKGWLSRGKNAEARQALALKALENGDRNTAHKWIEEFRKFLKQQHSKPAENQNALIEEVQSFSLN